jgi:transmembrane sensor
MTTERLRYLLDAYRSGAGTPGEIQELHGMLREDWVQISLDKEAPEIDWEAMYRRIMAAEGAPVEQIGDKAGKAVRMNGGMWAAAAVLVVALGIAAVVALVNSRQTERSIATDAQHTGSDVSPGGYKALLKLANGRTILLDSAAKGLLALQGKTHIAKMSDGTVAYTPSAGEKQEEVLYNTMETPRGGQYRLTLPDGTQVWLNAASSITYPVAFTGGERRVTLTGEAYFEVVHQAHQPFKVRVGNREIEDLGTYFDINAYADEPVMETTLLEGSVKIGNLVLKPGEQARMNRNGQITLTKDVDTDQAIAWKNGKFQFGDKADIAAIMRQVARWYDVDVKYMGPVTGHIGGSISRNVNASQVLRMLEITGGVHFKIEGRKVTVMP